MNEDSGNGAVVFILLDRQDSILHHHSCANSLHGLVIQPCASDSSVMTGVPAQCVAPCFRQLSPG